MPIASCYPTPMAKPHKKGPTTTVDVFCSGCKTQLFTYRKGGKGALIKCFKERISKDFTQSPGTCPACDQVFARDTLVRGTPAFKIIGDKVFSK
ncbi:hypothetical protein [Marinicella meishanensis]|uniref:hypothetical protein n=1 Tax=Marinicella meishanensis TaxID=2873263 RepID=UPI001CBE5255|nr:hypothetical protein [Marinicella sp. NBU2979]